MDLAKAKLSGLPISINNSSSINRLRKNLSNSLTNQKLSANNSFTNNYAQDNAIFIERGPYNVPGRTRPILVDVSDPTGNTWFAGSTGGGVWKTTDESVTWTEVSNGMESIAISWLGQCKSQPNVLYAAVELDKRAGAVYRSENSGGSWSKMSDTVSGGTGPHYYQELVASPHVFEMLSDDEWC